MSTDPDDTERAVQSGPDHPQANVNGSAALFSVGFRLTRPADAYSPRAGALNATLLPPDRKHADADTCVFSGLSVGSCTSQCTTLTDVACKRPLSSCGRVEHCNIFFGSKSTR